MKRLSSRYLLQYSTEQLWDILVGDFILVFDNGEELVTNDRHTLYSSYFWAFLRKYPTTPMLPNHHVQHVLKGKALTSKTHIELLGQVYWAVADHQNLRTPKERDDLTRMVYEVVNTLYNDLSYRAEASVVSIDILDFLEVIDHPTIRKALNEVTCGSGGSDTDYGRATIDHAHATVLSTLNNVENLQNNALAKAMRAKLVNNNQVLQCVSSRGFVTDVDGLRMPVPVTRSYTEGMGSLYNLMGESRSAAKSLYFSESPLQDSEYFARRLQLMCMVIERLYYIDCGSTDYVHWYIKPPIEVNGRITYPGDVKFLVGKYYLDEETHALKAIKANDNHLFGKTLKLRSVLNCCHPDPHGVCAVCFGQLSDNVSPEANLGHICSATMTQQTSQAVLSTKHLDASASSEPITLSELGRRYFTVGKNGSTLLLKESIKTRKVPLIVSQEEAFGLTDILLVSRIEDINTSRVSKIEIVGFEEYTTSKDVVPIVTPVVVGQNGRSAMFTHSFLAYLKEYRWEMDTRGNFIFDLQHWDCTKPIMQLPEMEYSFSIHSHQIADIIESRMKEIGDRMKPESPIATLVELFDLVNAKLNVNLALLEVVMYATMIRHGEADNFDLARNAPDRSLGVSDMTLRNRSLSAAYSYEKQLPLITDPRSYYGENRPDSVFDVFIRPREVVAAYKHR